MFADGASLLDAAQSNDIDSAMMSIDQGVGVNTTSPDGATALIIGTVRLSLSRMPS